MLSFGPALYFLLSKLVPANSVRASCMHTYVYLFCSLVSRGKKELLVAVSTVL